MVITKLESLLNADERLFSVVTGNFKCLLCLILLYANDAFEEGTHCHIYRIYFSADVLSFLCFLYTVTFGKTS